MPDVAEIALPADWVEAMQTGVMPDFPERGLYRQWDQHWNPAGYSPEPHHPGQAPTRFPPHWSPGMCSAAAHLADPLENSKVGEVS